jgi:hypothetical protein
LWHLQKHIRSRGSYEHNVETTALLSTVRDLPRDGRQIPEASLWIAAETGTPKTTPPSQTEMTNSSRENAKFGIGHPGATDVAIILL